MNNCSFVGRTTRDGDFKYLPNGTPVLAFTLAVDRGRKDAAGNKQADFFDHVFYGERAEKIASWVTKGRLLATSGRLQIRQYESAEGQKRKATEIVIQNVDFLDKKKSDDNDLGREVADDEAPF